MIIKKRHKQQLKSILLLSIIMLNTVSALIFSIDFSNSPAEFVERNKESEELENIDPIFETLKSSDLGNDTWWDNSFQYRRIIKITNPYSVNFTNFGAKFTFNYQEFGNKIQNDLDDIRIVEYFKGIPVLRNYYVVKDYPISGNATVWFDTNITKEPGHSGKDTYMYYGNSIAVNAEARSALNSFGYVKNGDFEYDINTSPKFIPNGWNFTDDPIDSMQGVNLAAKNIPNEPYNNTEILDSYEQFVFRLTSDTLGYHGIGNGNYAYKWGNPANSLPNTQCFDYVGTTFSYPFTVPRIEGGNIGLKLWRNIYTYIFMPSNSLMDYDGYFIRLCNGSASKYSNNVDIHEDVGSSFNNYLEAYGGNAKFAARWRQEYELRKHYVGDIKHTELGELNGYIEIDLTPYMGTQIFLEFGSWGREDGDLVATNDWRSSFFQLDDVKFNYTLTGSLDEQQKVDNQVTIVAVDVDGRIVPNVNIFIVNNSVIGGPNFIVNSSVASNGIITFTNVPRGRFNITANYTLANGSVIEVFNSSKSGFGAYYFNGINYTIQIQLDIWTIDFEIVDWNAIPLSIGYIELKDKVGTWLQNLSLDENGKATFRWLNDSRYYYKIYYDNEDYIRRKVPLNESYIYRSAYINDNIKYTHHTINLNETHIGSYLINERIYTNYLNDIGNKKINKATITLTDMDNYLEDISIYYIDKDNSTGTGNENLIYYKQYPNPPNEITDDIINLDISLIDNTKLQNDNFEVYGLLLVINGANFTTSNGKTKIDLIETCNEFNKTKIARLNIKTTYFNTLTSNFEEISALIKINSLINLTSNANAIPPLENGFAYGQINEVPFWFIRGETYNFTINVANLTLVDFNITYCSDPTQWIPGSGEKIKEYNFTLWENTSIFFNIIPEAGFNFTKFQTKFNNSYITGSVYWGGMIYLWAEFLYTENNWKTSNYMTEPPGICSLIIRLTGSTTILFNIKMQFTGSNGNYSLIFDSSKLSAGISSENYIFEIRGYHPTYDNPIPEVKYVEVKSIPTVMNSYNYETRTKLINNRYNENFGEIIKITVSYNITSSGQALLGASIIYSWSFGSGILNPDPIYNGFYTLFLNTSLAITTGLKVISMTASFENYTNIGITTVPLVISLYVEPRPTLINNQTGFYYISQSIWVKDTHYFSFEYRDVIGDKRISDLGIYSYSWQETDASGSPLGESGSGDLIENSDHLYILDFDTEQQNIGYYLIYISMQKDNYELKTAVFHLEIKIRILEAELDATNLDDDLISVVKGKDIDFEITLIDNSRGGIPLSGATVTIEIGDKEYDMEEEEPGVYRYTFETDDVDAYFTSKTYAINIKIEKLDFDSEEIEATLVVQMEEIFTGIPAFYFWLVLAAISGVFGSLIGYKVVQQARIPIFVKKVRKVSKSIKANKSVPLMSIPTKGEMLLEDYGKDWREIGLELKELLGVKETKSGVLSKAKKRITKRGDIE